MNTFRKTLILAFLVATASASDDIWAIGKAIGSGILAGAKEVSSEAVKVTCDDMSGFVKSAVAGLGAEALCGIAFAASFVFTAADDVVQNLESDTVTETRSLLYVPGVGDVYKPHFTDSEFSLAYISDAYELGQNIKPGFFPLDGYGSLVPVITYNHTAFEMGVMGSEYKPAHLFIGYHEEGYKTVFAGGESHSDLYNEITSASSDANSLKKREATEKIKYASYSYVDGNYKSAKHLLKHKTKFENFEKNNKKANQFLEDNLGKKICVTGFGSPNIVSLTLAAVESIVEDLGELYINGHGRINSYCKNFKGDAEDTAAE